MTRVSGNNSATSWHRFFGMCNDASCHVTDRGSTIPRLATLVFLCALLMAGCGTRPETRLPPPAIKVGAISVDKGEITQSLEVSGNLQFIANTTVSSEVAAQVQTIDVRDGQIITQGQTLLTFDASSIHAAADQARGNLQKNEAALAFNKTEWEKNLPLLRSGAISQSTYDQKFSSYQTSVGQVESDKGALAKALEDLKHTIQVAPIHGVLSSRYVEKGDWVAAGAKLFSISNYETVFLQTFLSDKDVGRLEFDKVIREGGGVDADVKVDSRPGKTFGGTVGYIQPLTNQNRLFEVRIYIGNSDLQLLQGMYARAWVVVNRLPGVTRIPIDALLDQIRKNDRNTVVHVDAQQKAEILPIRIGEIGNMYAEVLEGLKPGDQVVVQGKEILNAGQPLEVAPRAAFASEQTAKPE